MSAVSGDELSTADLFLQCFDAEWCGQIGYPQDAESAMEGIMRFYRRKDAPLPEKDDTDDTTAIPWDFAVDADIIQADFQRVYNIDLSTAEVHWWRFMALMEGLYSYSLADRVGYRVADVSKVPQAQRADYLRKRNQFVIHADGETSFDDHIERLKALANKSKK